ncbi:MAG: hypothetical protein OEO79_08590 [Gemmatimonadota bacterium]|nr:hypothetical protein [Gemmatimonadota bacterium]
MANLPEKIYTEQELTRARSTAQVVGWLQGAGVVVGGVLVWNLLGWIPMLIGVAAVGWVLYKLLSGPGTTDEE